MEGDQALFTQNYHQFKDKIFNYFWYRVNFNRELAEDLTSEVFIKAMKNFTSFKVSQSFQAWIFTIAHNHLVDHYKKKKRDVSLEDILEMADGDKKAIENKVFVKEVIVEIERLPDYYQEVVTLKYINGLTTKEMSEILEKEEGAIRTALSRAVKELKGKIDGDGKQRIEAGSLA